MIRTVDGDDDLARHIALRERVDPLSASTVADQRVFLEQTEAPLLLLAGDAGFGTALRFPGETASLDLGVVIADDDRLRRELFERLEAHARGQGWETLLAGATGEEAVAFLESRGFEIVDRQERVVLDLGPGNSFLPGGSGGGFALTDFAARPDLAARLHALAAEGIADIPGGLAEEGLPDLETWLESLRAPSRRADFLVIALDGEEPIGWASLNVYPRVAWHGFTVVARAARRRGVARALKLELIRRARAIGLERLITQSNEANRAMRTLNDELGYRPAPPRTFLRR